MEECPICKFNKLDVKSHFGVKCCGLCENHYHRYDKEAPKPCKASKPGQCWEGWKATDKNSKRCASCRLFAFRKIGCKLSFKFEQQKEQNALKKSTTKNNIKKMLTMFQNVLKLEGETLGLKSPPAMVQIQMNGQTFRFHEEGMFLLREDFRRIQYNFTESLSKRLSDVAEGMQIASFMKTGYSRTCECECENNNLHQESFWNSERVYHYLFDFVIRRGWVEPITETDESIRNKINKCPKGRGKDAASFQYLNKTFKINPYHSRLGKLQEIGRTKNCKIEDPMNCKYCVGDGGIFKIYKRNTAHLAANLLIQFKLATAQELRAFTKNYCSNEGLPINAIELLYFFMFSGKFVAFCPENYNLPIPFDIPNELLHHPIQFGHDRIDDSQLFFAFCHNKIDAELSQGNANYFGNKKECFMGLAAFPTSTYLCWYFVPIEWLTDTQRIEFGCPRQAFEIISPIVPQNQHSFLPPNCAAPSTSSFFSENNQPVQSMISGSLPMQGNEQIIAYEYYDNFSSSNMAFYQ